MRRTRLVAALIVALASTSAYGAGNGNANGYDNGNAFGHDKGDRDEAAPAAGGSATGASSPVGQTVLSPEGSVISSDQNIALDAVESGEALPLSDIVKRIRKAFSARVLDARLIERGARLIYRLTILTDAGVSKRVDLDAKAGTVVRSR